MKVDAANEAVKQIFNRIEGLREAAECDVARQPWGVAIYRKGYAVHVIWDNHYSNTLRDSKLFVREWSGRPDFGPNRYAHVFEKPSQLAEHPFTFDLVNGTDMGWREVQSGRFRTNSWIADFAVKRLLELVRAAKGTRDDWA